jgi:hypothetical protein
MSTKELETETSPLLFEFERQLFLLMMLVVFGVEGRL